MPDQPSIPTLSRRTLQRTLRIERAVGKLRRIERAFQIVIQRIAIEQRRSVNQNQALMLIGDVQVGIHRVNRLLFVY